MTASTPAPFPSPASLPSFDGESGTPPVSHNSSADPNPLDGIARLRLLAVVPVHPASLPLGPGVTVLGHHPDGVVALDKPPGLLSHPNKPADTTRSLLAAPYESGAECYLLPDGARAHLLHRLDSATSGVVLLATDDALATAIKKSFQERAVQKTYLALVFGVPRQRQESWQDHLQVRRSSDRLRVSNDRDGDTASTGMRLLRTFNGTPVLSLLELTPHTGRTHQLRVQCGKRRLPIVGDATYGDFAKNRTFTKAGGAARLFLHAREVIVNCRYRGRDWRFQATSPASAEFERPR